MFEVGHGGGRDAGAEAAPAGAHVVPSRQAKRDYIKATTTHTNWLYLSRLAALKEHAFMKALGENGFPVPRAVDVNRHAVLMSLVDGAPLTRRYRLSDPGKVYAQCVTQLTRLAQCGLVHCDFNEFNIMCDDDERHHDHRLPADGEHAAPERGGAVRQRPEVSAQVLPSKVRLPRRGGRRAAGPTRRSRDVAVGGVGRRRRRGRRAEPGRVPCARAGSVRTR